MNEKSEKQFIQELIEKASPRQLRCIVQFIKAILGIN